ncbi:MAG: hypothetical protein K2Y05_09030 [Hyphomicrobiaceae bacterium]|nr:hypothetical protein [Hyphomicrobiaceae bacterium]
MRLADLSMMTERVAGYRTGTVAALRDLTLLAVAKARRSRLRQVMVALDHASMRGKILPDRYLISRKIDGEFTCLAYRDGQVITINPWGTIRTGAPFHVEAAKLLAKAGVKTAILGGELYVSRPDGKRARVHDVTRIARAPETAAEVASLRFAAFAIYDLDGADMTETPGAAIVKLRDVFAGGRTVHPVETVEGNEAEVATRYAAWVEAEGEEGVVAIGEKRGWFKIKPKHSLDLAVVAFSEGTDDRSGMLHSLLLAAVREDGTFHLCGRTGGGFSDEQRVTLLQELSAEVADTGYIEVNSDRVAYKMIRPGRVAEISCLDVISVSSTGDRIDKMVLEWDAGAGRWSGVRRLPLVSIMSPQFERFRHDKSATAAEAGIAQLAAIAEIPEARPGLDVGHLPKSELLRRAVATKDAKGKTMVRKLLLWKTNKEQLSAEYPAYVLLLTDYSPNRKTPIEREIRVSSSLEQLDAYWTVWSQENFVKGWVVKETGA